MYKNIYNLIAYKWNYNFKKIMIKSIFIIELKFYFIMNNNKYYLPEATKII